MVDKNQKDLLVPGNLIGFQCETCGECCSSGWRVDIDKASYEKLIIAPEFPDFNEKTLRLKDAPDHMYAYMCLDKDGKCHYLSNDNLCMIHKKKGIGFLPDICRMYLKKKSDDKSITEGLKLSTFYI